MQNIVKKLQFFIPEKKCQNLLFFLYNGKLRQSSFVSYSLQMENDQGFSQQLCLPGVWNSSTHALCLPEQDALLTERPNCWPWAEREAFSSCKPVEDSHVASHSLTFTQGRGRTHADGQEWDPIQQHQKPTIRLGCPNTYRTKANKLESSLEHSAKAVCQGEIPEDYGLEPRMWGETTKEVRLKLTKFPSPPIAM